MRYAALAIGIIAGLVACLILALGGLDAAALAGIDERQAAVYRFGLYVIANLGIFGAGLALSTPLAGAILFLLGAIAWIGAAFVFRSSPNFLVLAPSALLLVAFTLALLDAVRGPRTRPSQGRRRRSDAEAAEAALTERLDRREPQPQDFDELPPVPIGAGFYGDGGPAPYRQQSDSLAALSGIEEMPRDRSGDNWRPGSRRPPPRQKPVFRELDDYEDEEGGIFARIARALSSILSFGLYAALAGAAVLVIWNLRGSDPSPPSAAKAEASSVAAVSTSSSSAAPEPSSSEPPPSSSSQAPSAESPLQPAPLLPAAGGIGAAPVFAGTAADAPKTTRAIPDAPSLPPESEPDPAPAEDTTTELPMGVVVGSDAETAPADTLAEFPAEANSAPSEPAVVQPFLMPAQIAAGRIRRTTPPTTTTTPASPQDSTGL